MLGMLRFVGRYLLCLLLLNLAACSSMQTVNLETTMQTAHARGIDYGSLVKVRTLDGKSARFRVTDITDEGLGGNQGFFRFEEMRSLQVENPHANNAETALNWVLGILGVAALVALVAHSDSVRACRFGPVQPWGRMTVSMT
jgi:hypothetical protein